jgi:hypothetical protein
VPNCIFCGTSPTTNAHIFREQWIEQLFPGVAPYRHWHQRDGDKPLDVAWEKRKPDLKVNSVCVDCNSGWMNRLDHDAEDLFLTEAALGLAIKLTRHRDKKILARWCALVGALCDQTQDEPTLTTTVHRSIYDGEVPDGTLIWLLRTVPPPWEATGWALAREMQLKLPTFHNPHAYLVTFGINHFVAQVVVLPKGASEIVTIDRSRNASLLRQLWPPPLTPFFWPPPETLRWDQIEVLADTFQV